MSIEIKAPSFPESVADGTVATWHKQPGEACERDELIADIETDKVVIEINAPAEGALSEIIKAEGEIVLSNELIARFEPGEVAEAPAPAVALDEAAAEQGGAELIISPAAKKMMAENNISEADVTGTGKGGRVTKEDVQKAIAGSGSAETASAAPAEPARPAVNNAAPSVVATETKGASAPRVV